MSATISQMSIMELPVTTRTAPSSRTKVVIEPEPAVGDGGDPAGQTVEAAAVMISGVKGQTKQSKRLPHWLWLIIAKSLGIKLHDNDKPYVAWTLHLLTIASAVAMLFTRILFSGYDIASLNTETDILNGSVAIMMVLLYAGLGVYAHRLAFRLFVHPKLLEMMRLHSKTVFKLNTAIVVLLILAGFVMAHSANSVSFMYSSVVNFTQKSFAGKNASLPQPPSDVNPCQLVDIPLVICQTYFVSKSLFSFFFWIWNALVSAVLISVARTHTIAIRRFICQLEMDAHIRDQHFRRRFYAQGTAEAEDTLNSYLWLDNDHLIPAMPTSPSSTACPTSSTRRRQNQGRQGDADEAVSRTDEDILDCSPDFQVRLALKDDDEPSSGPRAPAPAATATRKSKPRRSQLSSNNSRFTFSAGFQRLPEELDVGRDGDNDGDGDGDADMNNTLMESRTMTEEEILHKHWKLSMSTRFTSLALQRWMSVVAITIMLWSVVQIIDWLSHSPNLSSVLSFMLPLLLLPLVASAYAEVNYEGQQALQNILPTTNRTAMFRYLYGMAIQMSVYGHPVTYASMGTVLAALIAAFLSKILLQEMNKLID